MSEPQIELQGLSRSFMVGRENVDAVKSINLKIYEGEFVIIFGSSGSGKTTLLSLIGGLEKPTSGRILVGGEDVDRYSQNQLASYRATKIGMVFQQFNLVPTLDARSNVAMPELLAGVGGRQARRNAQKILELLHLGNRIKHKPSQLSGGQQQKVAIARALSMCPGILLVDEPTGNLDEDAGREIIDLLRKINKETETTIVLVTHNPDYLSFADRVFMMKNGKIVSEKGHAKIGSEKVEQEKDKREKNGTLSTFETLRLSKIHFFSKGLRAFLTTLGVALGVGTIVSLVSLGVGLQKITSNQLASLDMLTSIGVSVNKNSINKLDDATIKKISAVKFVKLVSPGFNIPAKLFDSSSSTQITLEAIHPEALDFEGVVLDAGNKFSSEDGVILTKAAAKNFNTQSPNEIIGKTFGLDMVISPDGSQDLTKAKIEHLDEKIVGVSSDDQTTAAFISLAQIKSFIPDATYSTIKVKVDDRKNVQTVKTEIENMGFSTSSVVDLINKVDKVFLVTQIALGIIGSVALIVALIGIVNIMTVALLERTHEVGILKAIGARDSTIRKVFIYEVLFFGLFGSIAGILLSYIFGQAINRAIELITQSNNISGSFKLFETPLPFAGAMVVLTILVSLLGGWYPSRRAAKMSPMDALRYE